MERYAEAGIMNVIPASVLRGSEAVIAKLVNYLFIYLFIYLFSPLSFYAIIYIFVKLAA
jgi:hypothetical protein